MSATPSAHFPWHAEHFSWKVNIPREYEKGTLGDLIKLVTGLGPAGPWFIVAANPALLPSSNSNVAAIPAIFCACHAGRQIL